MIDVDILVDVAKVTRLQEKFHKYGPYAINAGLGSMNDFLNTATFKQSMYPPSQAGQPFIWSSERQRRAYFASNGFGAGIPYSRTNTLANSGEFYVDSKSFYIGYRNFAPYAKWVVHPSYQIIGHKARGWEPVNKFVVRSTYRAPLVSRFKTAALNAWEEMDKFITGSAFGL